MLSLDEIIIRLGLSIIIGGLIGAEREYRNKSAGFRTMILICMGSCLFTLISMLISNGTTDRIASNIVTGIGFVGAGVIFRSDNGISGITTAATIWVTAALGMCAAAGFYFTSLTGGALVLGVLLTLPTVEKLIDKLRQIRNYRIVRSYKAGLAIYYETLMKENHLMFKRIKQTRIGEKLTISWVVRGKEENHELFIEAILTDDAIQEFEF